MRAAQTSGVVLRGFSPMLFSDALGCVCDVCLGMAGAGG